MTRDSSAQYYPNIKERQKKCLIKNIEVSPKKKKKKKQK